MDAEPPAAKLSSLNAELAAKSSRISELEDRVSSLQADNAQLREALALARAAGRAGARGPASWPLAACLCISGRRAAIKVGGSAACDVYDFGDEEGVGSPDSHSNKGRNPEGAVVATPTPRRRRVMTGEGEDGADVEEDAEGGGASDEQEDCAGLGLEDDDVSATLSGSKKRAAARVVTSDSEDEDHAGKDDADDEQEGVSASRKRGLCGISVTEGKKRAAALVVISDSENEDHNQLGSGKDDVDDEQEGVPASRKRGLCGISDSDDEDVAPSNAASRVVAAQIESGDEDDLVPIRQVLKKMRKKWEGDADDGLPEARGRSAPTTRRPARLVKNQSKEGRASGRVSNFVEPKESEGSEDDMEDDEDMDGFINDEDSSENASLSSDEESRDQSDVSDTPVLNEESSPGAEESDIVADYTSVMARIGRKKKAEEWKFEGDMLAAFAEHPELRLKAVCALYRRQTQEEQLEKAALFHNGQGFNHIDARRGSHIAEFLLDGDLDGPLTKTISDLEEYDPYALGFCHKVAKNYSKQLFAIYQNKEDPYFHP